LEGSDVEHVAVVTSAVVLTVAEAHKVTTGPAPSV
jgi:hypothetical protein